MAEPSSLPTLHSRTRRKNPAPAPGSPNDPVVTNQTILSAFARAGADMGAVDPWMLLERSGLNLATLSAARNATYTGPDIHAMTALTDDERSALHVALARLTDKTRPAAPVPAAGALRLDPVVMSTPLAPTVARAIATPLPDGSSAQAQMMARIWNRYGGLLDTVGTMLQVDPSLAGGVLAVESGGRTFSTSGRMIIRFEVHIFWNVWGKSNQEQFNRYFRFNPDSPWRGDGHQWRPDENSEWKSVHTGQDGEWAALGFARVYCSDVAAKLSISMGAPQIMGFNHARISYADVHSMYDAFENDERSQIVGFFDFVRTDNRLLEAMRREDLQTFATYYNGPANASTYARLMVDATTALRALLPPVESEPDVCRPLPPAPPTGQPYGAPAPGRENSAWNSSRPLPVPGQLPIPPADGVEALRQIDPVLYGYWQENVREGFVRNNEMFRRVLNGFMEPYHITIWMYRVLFSVGILAFLSAIGFSLYFGQPMYALIFGGLSTAAFISYFINRPLQSLEENLHFITWLGIIYNTYWTRLAYMFDQRTVQQDLHNATSDAIQDLDRLLDKHAELSGRRPKAQ